MVDLSTHWKHGKTPWFLALARWWPLMRRWPAKRRRRRMASRRRRHVWRFGVAAGKQDFNGTKTYKKNHMTRGNQDPLAMGYSMLLPIFGRGCGDNRRFLLARLSHTMNWNEISWARQRLGRLGSWWSQADVLIKSAEDQLPYGCGVACKVWRQTLTTWFGGLTPPWSASSSSALVHMGPHGILPCCLNF